MERAAQRPRWISAVPNALSGGRLALALWFPLAPPAWYLSLVVTGALTDWLDGLVARRFDAKSTSGALLDAIADKMFVVSVLLTLIVSGQILWWHAVLVVSRDLVVAAIAAYAVATRDWGKFKQMPPRIAGKLTTLLVFLWFAAVVTPWSRPAAPYLLLLTAGASALSAADYLLLFARALRARRAHRSSPESDS